MPEQMRPQDNLQQEARRELYKIIGLPPPGGNYEEKAKLFDQTWAWHLRHSTREVGRKEITRLLWPSSMNNMLCIKFSSTEQANKLVDDLLALFSPAKARVWCSHFKYSSEKDEDGLGRWLFNGTAGYGTAGWDICPVAGCHAPRPRPEGGDGT